MRGDEGEAPVPRDSNPHACACDRSIGYVCGACQLRILGMGMSPALVGYTCHRGQTHRLNQVIVTAHLSVCECGTFRVS